MKICFIILATVLIMSLSACGTKTAEVEVLQQTEKVTEEVVKATEEETVKVEETTELDNPEVVVLTNEMSASEYIASIQLSREQVRAKNKETVLSIINNPNIEESEKQAAVQNMVDLAALAEKEHAAETLLMAKGFADSLVSITDGLVDVFIIASSLTDEQRAQIEEIVMRKTEVSAENIVITLIN